jgi:hypothetical protein
MKQGLGVSLDLHIEPYDGDHVLSPQEIEEAKADLKKLYEETEGYDLYIIGIACKIAKAEVKDIEEYTI